MDPLLDPQAVPARLVAPDWAHAPQLTAPRLGARPVRGAGPDGARLRRRVRAAQPRAQPSLRHLIHRRTGIPKCRDDNKSRLQK